MSRKNFKHDIFTQLARVGKALGNGNRLEILEFLAQGERSVDDLAGVAGLTVANTSQHLQQLRQAGLVISRKQGLKVYYQLGSDDVVGLLSTLRAVAARHLAEVDRLVNSYLTVKDNLEPVLRGDLLTRAREGLVTVIDVRPVEEYIAGHVPGAVNIPVCDLEKQLDRFDPGQQIVAYCRGPYCILAFDAVAKLRAKGYHAHRLEEGFPEWRRAGLPIELG